MMRSFLILALTISKSYAIELFCSVKFVDDPNKYILKVTRVISEEVNSKGEDVYIIDGKVQSERYADVSLHYAIRSSSCNERREIIETFNRTGEMPSEIIPKEDSKNVASDSINSPEKTSNPFESIFSKNKDNTTEEKVAKTEENKKEESLPVVKIQERSNSETRNEKTKIETTTIEHFKAKMNSNKSAGNGNGDR